MTLMKVCVTFALVLLLALQQASAAWDPVFSPTTISTDVGNVTLSISSGAAFGDYVFLYDRSDCSTAPLLTPSSYPNRTNEEQVQPGNTVRFNASELAAGTFFLCHSNNSGLSYAANPARTMTVIHTVWVAPGVLNKDQNNVTVTMRHSTAGRSVFLLKQLMGGEPTRLKCEDLPSGALALVNRTAIVAINGDLTAMLDIAHLDIGEYIMCYSTQPFVSEAVTPFYGLAQTIVVISSPLCTGGGASGICAVVPTNIDRRMGYESFMLYPARPRTHAFLLRKEVCGVSTYTCASNRSQLEAAGYATNVGRVGFDRRVSVNVSALIAGSDFVVCFLNVTSDDVSALISTFVEVTSASISVSGGPDPTQSVVSCCSMGNTYVAGQTTTCTVYAYDFMGLPSGVPDDVCEMHALVTDPNGAIVCASALRFRSLGRFEFDFNATVAGTTLVAMQYHNNTNTSVVVQSPTASVVRIVPATFDERNSLASCSRVGAVDICAVTNRDGFGNPIAGNMCTSRSDNTFSCNGGPF